MAVRLSTILKQLPPWLRLTTSHGDIVRGVVGRLVRNIRHHNFPGWSTVEDRLKAEAVIMSALADLPECQAAYTADMADVSLDKRRLLLLRKQLTPCMGARQKGCRIILPKSQDKVFFINEEEHLAIHFFDRGDALDNTYRVMKDFASTLEESLDIAANARQGYLSSLAIECGDGMQLYCVLHLPAINMAGQIPAVNKALEELELSMAPFHADQNNDTGNLFTIYTLPSPLGETDTELEKLKAVVATLFQRETQLRLKLWKEKPLETRNSVGRALGLLLYSHLLNYREMLNAFSSLSMGISLLPLAQEEKMEYLQCLADMSLSLSPSHLAFSTGSNDERQLMALRSEAVRRYLQHTTFQAEFTPQFTKQNI